MTGNKMSLFSNLGSAVSEKDVENAWRAALSKAYPGAEISSPYKCDGYIKHNNIRMLCEFKFNPDMKTKDALPVIGQSIYYLKKFADDGAELPNIIFVADKNECFVIPVSSVIGYTKKSYDWSAAPCDAGKNLQLMADLTKDEAVSPFVFDIGSGFKWAAVSDFIDRCVRQVKAETPITSKNIQNVYDYWRRNVVKQKLEEAGHISAFLSLLTNPQSCYKHPKKENVLVIGGAEIKIDGKAYNGFFSRFKESHNPAEIREITANKDRLINEITRRRTGAFFTPSDWVNEAHKMLSESLGSTWKEDYVVWDASCGTGNLTRDYSFKELYLSTLEQSDIDIINEAGYNKEANKFQFDFLNDPLDKLPAGLIKAFKENKKIVFFNNPPYGTANDLVKGGSKAGVASGTLVNKAMKDADIGPSSQQMYAQFMYRGISIASELGNKNAVLATFTKCVIVNGDSFFGFRKLLNRLEFLDGMSFQADNFADVADTWAISFTIFKTKQQVSDQQV
jgi:hypothetical protein